VKVKTDTSAGPRYSHQEKHRERLRGVLCPLDWFAPPERPERQRNAQGEQSQSVKSAKNAAARSFEGGSL
jgi:hypothetical protein